MGTKAATPAGRRSAAARTKAPAGPKQRPAAKRSGGGPAAKGRPAAGRTRPAGRKAAARPKPRASARGAAAKARRRRPPSTRRTARRGTPRRPACASSFSFGWRARLTALAALLACGTAGYMLWLRDSPLVAVTDVEVVGVRSGERERILEELTRAAEGMTTLNVDVEELRRVGAQFPTVASLSADANFPRGLRIEVTERPPALVATSGEEEAAVAADGSVLSGVEAPNGLPRVAVERLPSAGRLEGADLEQAVVAGTAPAPLAPLIERVSASREFGVEVELRGGVVVRFGDALRAQDKWTAAAAALADPKLTYLAYLDVRVPERPARGGA